MAQIKENKAPMTPEMEAVKANMEFQRKKERELVRGKFIFHEVPGGIMEFNFKKYKGDPLEKFSFNDGEIYTIPLGVARHLNTNCKYPSYTFSQDSNGRPKVGVGEWVRRCSFQSLEFVDIEDVPSTLPKAVQG
jgi:hypothetical protein